MGGQGGGSVEGGKRNVKVYSKCQRRKRCSALEPVLEHCELASTDVVDSSATNVPQQQCSQNNITQKGMIPLRILAKLRDGYVKLMNEMASGADLSGVSSFYGATGPGAIA